MNLYTAKPMRVEAVFLDTIETGLTFLHGHYGVVGRDFIVVDTYDGPIRAKVGQHWLVHAGGDNYWPVRKDTFTTLFTEDAP